MGGFADTKRAKAHFVFPIPDGIDPALAAPMLVSLLYLPPLISSFLLS